MFANFLCQRPPFTLIGLVVLCASGCGGHENTTETPAPSPSATAGRTDYPDEKQLPVVQRMFEFKGNDHWSNPFDSRSLEGVAWIGILLQDEIAASPHMGLLFKMDNVVKSHAAYKGIQLVGLRAPPPESGLRPPVALTGRWLTVTVDPDIVEKWRSEINAPRDGNDSAIAPPKTDDKGAPIYQPLAIDQVISNTRLVLVDAAGRVRGKHYEFNEPGLEALFRDMHKLFAELKGIPDEIFDPAWLESRRVAQIEDALYYDVFHDFQFVDDFYNTGIRFRNKIVDDAGKAYLAGHYDHGNGVAVADVDGDGHQDLYFVSQVGGNELWRNRGNGRFEDITESAGVGLKDRVNVTASFADIDNDGDPDLYVTSVRFGNALFENDGTGKFRDITDHSNTGYVGHSSGAVFFDYDRDGLLDLFVANVGKYTIDEKAKVTMESLRGESQEDYYYYDGITDAFGGHLKPNERNERSVLYKNEGGNVFRDVTEDAGLVDDSWAGDATPLDINNDGWPDLYLTSMQGNDEYYENQEGKSFVRKSRDIFPKTPWGSMGIKSFDYDNDGDFDVYVTDMHSDMSQEVPPHREKEKADMQFPESFLQTNGQSIFGNAFYENQGDGTYTEVSDEIGAENYWPWGLSVGDLNADGYQDVFIASGMNMPFRYGINSVLLNDAGNRFLDAEFVLGVEPRFNGRTAIPWYELDCDGADKGHIDCEGRTGRVTVWSALGSRSSVLFDLDNDGDLDIVTNDFNSRPLVLISNLSTRKSDLHFLKVELQGTESNRQGLGAIVRVTAGENTYAQMNDGQSGYLSQSAIPLYFGLADTGEIDSVEVQWPSGRVQKIEGPISSNQLMHITESQE